MFVQYKATGYVWEQYDDRTGKGKVWSHYPLLLPIHDCVLLALSFSFSLVVGNPSVHRLVLPHCTHHG